MKTFAKTASVIGMFAISGLAMADQCPDTLNADEMYDCIVVDGAGGTYKHEDAADKKAAPTADSDSKDASKQAKAPLQHSVN